MIKLFRILIISILISNGTMQTMEPESSKKQKIVTDEQARELGMQLIEATESDNLEQMKMLIDAGADVNYAPLNLAAPKSYGPAKTYTALLMAVRTGNKNIKKACALLIVSGANVNYADWRGDTALTIAAHGGRKDICELLITAGANTFHHSHGGTPLMWPIINENQPLCELLVEKMLSLPDETQKQRIYTLLNCFRLHPNPKINSFYYIRKIFVEPLHALIKEENAAKTLAEVNYPTDTGAIRQHLRQRYFPSSKEDASPEALAMMEENQ